MQPSNDPATDNPPFRNIYTISRLNSEVRTLLESGFPLLWIEAEISNLARPASGHLYFSLKDEKAQVRCAMFRNRSLNLGFSPKNGMQVLVRAKIGLYEPRGDFQLIIEHMEEAGNGALRRAFDELKLKLDKEGLFDARNKQPLPTLPRCVGIVTSPSGAAVRDVITTLQRRFPALPVIVYPVPVQGEGAAQQIADMIAIADRRQDCDVLIVGRGGGSLEDLWAFNEEVLVRAIHACRIPVVTAIGHEVDFTIADFVADQRAATPTGAAELISPDRQVWLSRFRQLRQRLDWLMRQQCQQHRQTLQNLTKRLQHSGRRLLDKAQRLDELELRLQRALQYFLRQSQAQLSHSHERLLRHSPVNQLGTIQTSTDNLSKRLTTAMQHQLTRHQNRLQQLAGTLDTVSPLATLSRGYAIVIDENGHIIRQARQVKVGDPITARLAEGRLYCQVTRIKESND